MNPSEKHDFFNADGKNKKNQRTGWNFQKIFFILILIILGYMFIRYLYGSTAQETLVDPSKKSTFNAAEFKKKEGKPMFDSSKMVPIEKEVADPEGCPPFAGCGHCKESQDRVIQKDQYGCRTCACITHNAGGLK